MKRTSPRRPSFAVATDGQGVVNHAGVAALRELADRLGYTRTLCDGLDPLRADRTVHHPGAVLTDLVVMFADGGDCLSNLSSLNHQPDLFGHVASVPTAWRVINRLTEDHLARLRQARLRQARLRQARRQLRQAAWQSAGRPERLVLDIDATLVTSHSDKERAAGNYKHGFGFHPWPAFWRPPANLLPPSCGETTPVPTLPRITLLSSTWPANSFRRRCARSRTWSVATAPVRPTTSSTRCAPAPRPSSRSASSCERT